MRVIGDYLYVADPFLGSTLRAGAATHFYWQEGTEDVYTNDRGWRVADKAQSAAPADILAAGCSWTMGQGVANADTIVAHLERAFGRSVANLGVRNYSLLQAVRRVEHEISFARPRLVLLIYGDWHLDRCFKDNAYQGLLYRPVLKRNVDTGALMVSEPKALPPALLDMAADIERKKAARGITNYEDRQLDVIRFWARLRNGYGGSYLRKMLGIRNVQRLSMESRKDRRAMLRFCLAGLDDVCAAHEARAILCHVADPEELIDRALAERAGVEDAMVSEAASRFTRISHVPRGHVRDALAGYLTSNGIAAEDWCTALWAKEHNHPNKLGYELVADGITAGLKAEMAGVLDATGCRMRNGLPAAPSAKRA